MSRARPEPVELPIPLLAWLAIIELLEELGERDLELLGSAACPLCELRGGGTHDPDCLVERALLLSRVCNGDEVAVAQFVTCRSPCLPDDGPMCTGCLDGSNFERAIVGDPGGEEPARLTSDQIVGALGRLAPTNTRAAAVLQEHEAFAGLQGTARGAAC